EFRLADVHGASAAPTAMVVRVIITSTFRPARRQRLAASLAAHITPERKIGIVPLARRRDFQAAIENRLHSVEDLLTDERLEVAARRDAVTWHIDLRDVHTIAQHAIERLR